MENILFRFENKTINIQSLQCVYSYQVMENILFWFEDKTINFTYSWHFMFVYLWHVLYYFINSGSVEENSTLIYTSIKFNWIHFDRE